MHHRLDNTSDSIILSNPNILASGDYGNATTTHNNNSGSAHGTNDGNNNSNTSITRERPATNAPEHTNQEHSSQHLQPAPIHLPSCLVVEQQQGAGELAAIIPPPHRQSTTSHQTHGAELPLDALPVPPDEGEPELPLRTGSQQQRHQSVKQEYLGIEPEYGTVAADAKSASQLLLHRPIHQLLRD
uniref:Uncharacterized protein n=1 Tax=Anopheles culicifacies TaxID=139723 RepID=A0A182MTM7_9DIPT